jgi:hypothetical protein
MRKLICMAALSLAAFQGYSQKKGTKLSEDYTYKVSDPYRVFDAEEKQYFSKGNEELAIKFDGKEIVIQKFNTEKPSFLSEKKYEKYFPKNYSVESVLELGDKFYFFYSSWDGDNDKEQLFVEEIDFAKGEFTGEKKLLFQVDGHIAGDYARADGQVQSVWGMWTGGVQNKFTLMQSQDKKSVLVQYRKKPEVKRDTKSFDIIGLYTFDSSLTKLSGNEVTMPYTERRMNNLDYQLDNKGNLYMLTKVFHDDSNDDKKKRKDTEANYHVELFVIKSGSDKIDISKFENKDKFINRLWLFDTDKDYLVCAGFYSNGKGDFDDCDGIMGFKVKPDGKMYDTFYHEIPTEVLNQYETDRTKRKNEKKERKGEGAQFSDLQLKDLIFNADGSFVLVGEQDYIVAHTTYSQSGSRTYYTYHYCDLLVSKINADGKLGWMKKIAKNQKGMKGKGGMSYKYFGANDSHYFVFLDNVKNIDLPLNEEPKQHSDRQGGYLTSVKISDADGTLKKGSIFNARDVDDFGIHQFATNRVLKTAENAFTVEVYKKKKEDVLIKVVLN